MLEFSKKKKKTEEHEGFYEKSGEIMWLLVFLAAFSWSQKKTDSLQEIPFDPDKVIYKTKNSALGPFEILCAQRVVSPQHELIIRFQVHENSVKTKHELLRFTSYNDCSKYRFKLSKDLTLTMVSSPGERVDEPGATITVTYAWKKPLHNFEGINKKIYSPFKELQTQYRKILATAAIPKAEKLVIANRKKIEAYREIDNKQTQAVCEDFHDAYKNYADNLYKQKNYKQAFDIYLSLKMKFGDPQNLFYNASTKNDKMVLVCQAENSNADKSEDQFYAFARRYLHKIEFVPFLLNRIQKNLQTNTEDSKDLALQMLKFLSYLLKSAPHSFQLDYQHKLIDAWGTLVKSTPESSEYNRLIDEDTHLIFLLAEAKNCSGISQKVIDRIAQKNDNKEILKAMTLTAADDDYNEGLQQSAVFEYRQYVLGRVLLKQCTQIPKKVFERYFQFVQSQPYMK